MPPSTNVDTYQLLNIAAAAGTQISSRPGTLEALSINNAGTAWEIDVYDGVGSTGTRPIAKLRSSTIQTLFYMGRFKQGLFIDTVKGTTAGDLTVTYRDDL